MHTAKETERQRGTERIHITHRPMCIDIRTITGFSVYMSLPAHEYQLGALYLLLGVCHILLVEHKSQAAL